MGGQIGMVGPCFPGVKEAGEARGHFKKGAGRSMLEVASVVGLRGALCPMLCEGRRKKGTLRSCAWKWW